MDKLGFHCQKLEHIEEGILSNQLIRGEFHNFSEDEVSRLKKEINRHNIAMSIHAPLVKPDWYPYPPTWTFLCNVDKERKELGLRMIELSLQQANDYDTEYVVVHFPSKIDDSYGASLDELRAITKDTSYLISKLSEKYQIEIHIEGFGPNPFLNVDFLKGLFGQFPKLKYCFDTGHLNMESKERGLDMRAFATDLAEHVGSMHLWNNRSVDDYALYRHIPVHPVQGPEEGWADIPAFLTILWPHVKSVVFESAYNYPEALGGHNYKEGVQWVKQLAATLSS
jgi:sugar phosphate isomerase/epimerase